MSSKLQQFFNSTYCSEMRITDWGYVENEAALSYDQFSKWLEKKPSRILKYLDGDRGKKRKNLKSFYPDFQSSLVFIFSYADEKKTLNNILKKNKNNFSMSSYIFGFDGEDYHFYLKRKLLEIGNSLSQIYSDFEFKLTLDTHPILDRDLAYKAGLGWFGKNSMLISRAHGSFSIIGSLLINQKLDYEKNDVLEADHCGTCTKCAQACPTDAINLELRTIQPEKCISTYTIEQFKEEIPPKGYPDLEKNIFGCDICQDVCPWNIKILKHVKSNDSFNNEMSNEMINFFIKPNVDEVKININKLGTGEFKRKFKSTPLERSGKRGLLKNLNLF